MPTFTAAFASANGPYNLYKVIRGTQTTGVTKKTGIVIHPGVTVNQPSVSITPTAEVSGILYYGDATIKASNKAGTPLSSGDTVLFPPRGSIDAVSLYDLNIDPDTDAMVVSIQYS